MCFYTSVFQPLRCSGTFRKCWLMEPYAMIQVSILLSVTSQMGRNVASMFYHEIIKIRDFVQGSLIDNNV